MVSGLLCDTVVCSLKYSTVRDVVLHLHHQIHKTLKIRHPFTSVGRASSVGIVTRHGLDGLGIESWWWGGGDFPHLSRPTLGLPLQGVPVLHWGKAAGAWC